MRFIQTVILCFLCSSAYSQSELNFYVNDNLVPFPQGTLIFIDTTDSNDCSYFIQHGNESTSQIPHSISNLKGKIWLLIPLDSVISIDNPFIVLTNPHINFVSSWWLDKDKHVIKTCVPTGDHIAFNSREIKSSVFSFQNPNVSLSKFILLSVDKRNEVFNLNIHITNLNFIENRLTQDTALFGWLIGIVVVIFIITWVLFFFARDRIYLFYGGFLFFMLCYSFGDFSFWHWIFAYNTPENLDSIRPITLAESFIFYVFFILRALNVRENLPKSYKALRISFLSYTAYIVVGICVYIFIPNNEIKYFGILISHYFQRLLLAILVLTVVQSSLKRTPFALLICLSLVLFLSVHVVNYFFENGILPDILFFQHFLPIVYTIDCLVISVIIARTFIRFQKNSLDLSKELLIQNIDFTNKLNEVKEKDLTRISQYVQERKTEQGNCRPAFSERIHY